MDALLRSRLFARLAIWLLLGLCFAFWPLAGYASSLLVIEAGDGIDETAQVGLTVIKRANAPQAAIGTTITYTYQITNTGTVTLTTITATDNRLGPVAGLAGELAPGISRTATLTDFVEANVPAGPLVNTVTVTGTDSLSNTVVSNASTTVLIIDPTALPPNEQPNQPQRSLFLPAIKP